MDILASLPLILVDILVNGHFVSMPMDVLPLHWDILKPKCPSNIMGSHAGMSTLPKYHPYEKSTEMKCPCAGALQKRLQKVKCNFK